MRANNLLAPSRVGAPRGPRNHDGTIIPDTVDTMWGTDLTTTITGEGQVAVFVAVDHYSAECVGIHAARRATRFEALEPIRQGVRRCFGAFAKEIARGLAVRHDHGSQYMSDAFQKELAFLGIESSPAFVRAPEGNGCAERFIRTLKENLLWLRTFDTVEELRQALLIFGRSTTGRAQDHQSERLARPEPTGRADNLVARRTADHPQRMISDGGWFDRPGRSVFNLYKPPTIVPTQRRRHALARARTKVYPNDFEHIQSWLAHRVQRPGEKLNHALLLGGEQCIGKDLILARSASRSASPTSARPAREILGQFNPFLRSVILRVNEARDMGEYDRGAFYDQMKDIIAARDPRRQRQEHQAALHPELVRRGHHHEPQGQRHPPRGRRWPALCGLVRAHPRQLARGLLPETLGMVRPGR